MWRPDDPNAVAPKLQNVTLNATKNIKHVRVSFVNQHMGATGLCGAYIQLNASPGAARVWDGYVCSDVACCIQGVPSDIIFEVYGEFPPRIPPPPRGDCVACLTRMIESLFYNYQFEAAGYELRKTRSS
jgi:hypothetical protein